MGTLIHEVPWAQKIGSLANPPVLDPPEAKEN
jgi:hypothetical protein